MGKYVLGNITFGSLKSKQTWILDMSIHDLKYIKGKKVSIEERNEMIDAIIKDLKKVKNSLNKMK